jgi:hypothetical protein
MLFDMRDVPLAGFVTTGQAEPSLVLALDRRQGPARRTPVGGVRAPRNDSAIAAERQERADLIHDHRIRGSCRARAIIGGSC